jgi:myo-inositol-1(or 4)-monophosphatase
MYRFGKPMRGKVGEVRMTGSIAYEMAMAARGVLQYTVTTGPHLWDVAGGVMLVLEAGGLILRSRRTNGLGALSTRTQWEPVDSLVPNWESGVTTMKELRRWTASLVLGSPDVVRLVTANMTTRRRLRHRLTRMVRTR